MCKVCDGRDKGRQAHNGRKAVELAGAYPEQSRAGWLPLHLHHSTTTPPPWTCAGGHFSGDNGVERCLPLAAFPVALLPSSGGKLSPLSFKVGSCME